MDEIEELGAEVVVVGNGTQQFAAAFREDFELTGPLLVDPELRAYRAAGLRRGRVEALSPRLAVNAFRALRSGARQGAVQGDPWQLGGTFVIQQGGRVTYAQVSREAGDHAPVDEILAALSKEAESVDEPSTSSPAKRRVGEILSRIVDPSIVSSFDRTGFRIHSLTFDPDDLDLDLSDRRCVVTGANSGIGFETALALADLGAAVVLVCRTAERGRDAVDRIRSQTGNRRVELETADMSDLASVAALAERLAAGPIDVLVHNAGVLPDRRIETADGLELCFATHVAGPFLLTKMLRDELAASRDGRLIWVSSGGMLTRRLNVDDPQWLERDYDGVVAYAETKRDQVVLADLWAQEFAGEEVRVASMHPGWADTDSVKQSLPRFHRATRSILRTAAEGADTVVWLAASQAARDADGTFFFDRRPRRKYLIPFTREREDERAALWELCERISRNHGGHTSEGR